MSSYLHTLMNNRIIKNVACRKYGNKQWNTPTGAYRTVFIEKISIGLRNRINLASNKHNEQHAAYESYIDCTFANT